MNRRTQALIAIPPTLVAGAVIVLAAFDGSGPRHAEAAAAPAVDTRLADAHAQCIGDRVTPEGGLTVMLVDDDQALIIDTNPLEGYNDRYGYGSTDDDADGLICVLRQLSTPQVVVSRVERTTALQGDQEATADGLAYRWTYHPDHGTEMSISYEEAP
jgi:hypothetical protein